MTTKKALAIGVDRYEVPFPSLLNAVKDARLVGGFLSAKLDFDVTFLQNPTSLDVERALSKIARELSDDSVFFFYFAGHAMRVGDSTKQSLLCRDASEWLLDAVEAPGALAPYLLETISREARGDVFFCFDVGREYEDQYGRIVKSAGGAGLRDALVSPTDVRNASRHVRGRRLVLHSCQDGAGERDDSMFAFTLVKTMKESFDSNRELLLNEELLKKTASQLPEERRPIWLGEPILLARKSELETTVKPVVAESPTERPQENVRRAIQASAVTPYLPRAHFIRKELQKRLELGQILLDGWNRLSEGDLSGALEKANAVLDVCADEKSALELKRTANEIVQATPTQTWAESSTRAAGYRQEFDVDGCKFGVCWIPAGEFEMGSPESEDERLNDEFLHHVKLTRGFWLLETPVTQSLYKKVMKKKTISSFKGDDHPVETIRYEEALEFCKKLTTLLPNGLKATLPTEAQWEYACRAGTTTPYWFGTTLNGIEANCNGEWPYGTGEEGPNLKRTTPVKKYAPNPWGLYDMHGNVWEWTLDWVDNSVWGLEWNGDAPTGNAVDPIGTSGDFMRAVRGGSWTSEANCCRAASRGRRIPNACHWDLGFRALLIYDDDSEPCETLSVIPK